MFNHCWILKYTNMIEKQNKQIVPNTDNLVEVVKELESYIAKINEKYK